MDSQHQPQSTDETTENAHQDQPSNDSQSDITPLNDFDWQDLQRRFTEEMETKKREELQIQEDFARLMNYYSVWASTPSTHEEERASKRLRTRITYVQHKEAALSTKQAHRKSSHSKHPIFQAPHPKPTSATQTPPSSTPLKKHSRCWAGYEATSFYSVPPVYQFRVSVHADATGRLAAPTDIRDRASGNNYKLEAQRTISPGECAVSVKVNGKSLTVEVVTQRRGRERPPPRSLLSRVRQALSAFSAPSCAIL